MAEPREIKHGDSEFAAVYAGWVKNGRPAQFDLFGSWGGAIIHTVDRGAACTGTDWVRFFVHASMGPTVFDETIPGGPTERGWEDQVPERGFLEFKRGPYNKLTISKDELPRDEITLA